jgi:hypothetical protein
MPWKIVVRLSETMIFIAVLYQYKTHLSAYNYFMEQVARYTRNYSNFISSGDELLSWQ